MERHRCKLCYRRFAHGRALAGHMRSHVAYRGQEAKSSATHTLRENRRKSFRLADPEISSSSAIQDHESDTESSLHRRPKRGPSIPSAEPPSAEEPLSSVSDALSKEDVARWLVMLSRDAWSKSEAEDHLSDVWDEVEDEEYEEEEEEEEEDNDGIVSRSRRQRSRFQRGTCRNVFRSCQDGGRRRRANQKRAGVKCVPTAAGLRIQGENSSGSHHGVKLWECPYCYRVFGSGQALGGHKRSHLSSASTATTSPALALPRPPFPSTDDNNNDSVIDLNLPAPLEEEAELSAVSVATEFARE